MHTQDTRRGKGVRAGWEREQGRRRENECKTRTGTGVETGTRAVADTGTGTSTGTGAGTGTGAETGKGTIMEREAGEKESSGIRPIRKEAGKKTRHFHSARGIISINRRGRL